jgi:hypothetical protein
VAPRLEEGGFTIKQEPWSEDVVPKLSQEVTDEKLGGFLLLDDIRRSSSGLQPVKEGCYEFLTKLLWPIWLVTPERAKWSSSTDSNSSKPAAARGFVPPANGLAYLGFGYATLG